jgi:hypothetical protein
MCYSADLPAQATHVEDLLRVVDQNIAASMSDIKDRLNSIS